MTLMQLSAIHHWLLDHKDARPLEFHTWDGVLTVWLMGWLGAPAELLLGNRPERRGRVDERHAGDAAIDLARLVCQPWEALLMRLT